mgnify:FL=1|jgi:transcriptional regulator with XRE-family HTH domain
MGKAAAKPAEKNVSAIGKYLKNWRTTRRMSQLDLACEADISARHLSFIETGRAEPSREMVITLSEALEIPLRDRNALLLAAGYAPLYSETDIDAPEMAHIRTVIDFMLESYNPYGAVALDAHWNVLKSNRAYDKLAETFFPGLSGAPGERPNMLRQIFSDEGMRPYIANWDEVAYYMIQRMHREAMHAQVGDPTMQLLEDLLKRDDVPRRWHLFDVSAPAELLIPVHLKIGDLNARLFSVITMLGTPQDITLQELRIEAFMPADEETRRVIAALMDG